MDKREEKMILLLALYIKRRRGGVQGIMEK